MSEIDVNAYATTAGNAAAGAPTVVETQQPGATGALRQVIAIGDPSTRANLAAVSAAGALSVSQTDISVSGSITTLNLNLNNGTATASSTVVLAGPMTGISTVSIQVTGTWTGTLLPQCSLDNANWIPMGSTALINVSTNTYSGTIPSAAQQIYQADIAGFPYFRVTASAAVTGTAVVTLRATNATGMVGIDNPLPSGGNTIGSVIHTDGTNIANILKSDGTAAGQNAIQVAGAFKEVIGSVAAVGTIITSTDVSNYKYLSLQLTGFGTATVNVSFSNDNVNFIASPLFSANGSSSSNTNITSAGVYTAGILARYMKVTTTTWSAGTIVGTLELYTQIPTTPATAVNATQTSTWNVGSSSATGSAIPTNAFSIGVRDTSGNLVTPQGLSDTTDGLATDGNGRIIRTGAETYSFNSTTWDRIRANNNTTTGDTGTKTASFAGATQTNFNQKNAYITVLCGTVSGTTPSLTAQLQFSPDAGTTWLNLGPVTTAITTTANTSLIVIGPQNWSQTAGSTPVTLTTGATTTIAINAPLPRTWRLNYTITGTTPSFAITAVYINYVGV
jgi:hypothetical protein